MRVRDQAWNDFPPEWMVLQNINAKQIFTLHGLLAEYCHAHPNSLRETQVCVDIDNQSVVHTFNNGRAIIENLQRISCSQHWSPSN